jgi:hypothetical protein
MIPVVPFHKAKITIKSQAVLDTVKDLPSSHLGSELYSPEIILPPQAMPRIIDDKYGYFMRYKPSRSFSEDDLNCTYTMRVAREYLTREAREKVCMDRNLHGTEVYTDDSDPVAMCMHSGWLYGEWGDDVDRTLMELPVPPALDEMVDEELTEKPESPIVPPEDMDLHITLRILPPLKHYNGVLLRGIQSREWGDNHEGMSWMVDKIRWVDERNSRGFARGGKARRARLEAAHSLVAMFSNGPEPGKELNKGLDRMVPLAQVAA